MRNAGNILNAPGESAREKRLSAFKTISFLVRSPENEAVSSCSNHPRENEREDEKEPDLRGRCPEDVKTFTVSYPSAGEKMFTSLSPPGKSCRDFPPTKNECVDYPGRFVLYSRHFRPLNQTISTEYKNNQSGEL